MFCEPPTEHKRVRTPDAGTLATRRASASAYAHELRQHDVVVVVLMAVRGLQREDVLGLGVAGLARRGLVQLADLLQLLRRHGRAHHLTERARDGLHRLVVLGLGLLLLLGALAVHLLQLQRGRGRGTRVGKVSGESEWGK